MTLAFGDLIPLQIMHFSATIILRVNHRMDQTNVSTDWQKIVLNKFWI